jgi:hypothetical protein
MSCPLECRPSTRPPQEETIRKRYPVRPTFAGQRLARELVFSRIRLGSCAPSRHRRRRASEADRIGCRWREMPLASGRFAPLPILAVVSERARTSVIPRGSCALTALPVSRGAGTSQLSGLV